MIRMNTTQINLLNYFEKRKELKEAIEFYKERIGKLELAKLKATAGSAKKSLTIEKAVENLQKMKSKVDTKMAENQDMDFESYEKLKDWSDNLERQIKSLQRTQRKRVNIFEFSYELIEAIKDRVTIINMVDELKIRRTRSGAARYVINCPFHDEKTPSCMIYIEQDKYHCFGCQANGDVIDFYQNMLDLEFDEALIRLTDRLNIVLVDAEEVENADETISEYKTLIKEAEQELSKLKEEYRKESSDDSNN